jgi:hypothetical protein
MILTYASLAGASMLCLGLPDIVGWGSVALFMVVGCRTGPSRRQRAVKKKEDGQTAGDQRTSQ